MVKDLYASGNVFVTLSVDIFTKSLCVSKVLMFLGLCYYIPNNRMLASAFWFVAYIAMHWIITPGFSESAETILGYSTDACYYAAHMCCCSAVLQALTNTAPKRAAKVRETNPGNF